MDPLKFGKLLDHTNNKYIMLLTTKNIAVIMNYEKENFIRIFKNGDLVLEFRDTFISDNSFSRFINDTKFTFINDRIVRTEILSAQGLITIFTSESNNPLFFTFEANKEINQFITWFYLGYYQFKMFFWDCKNWSLIDWIITIYLYSIIIIIIFVLPIFLIYTFYLKFICSNLLLPEILNSFVYTLILNKTIQGNIIKLRKTKTKNIWNELTFDFGKKVFTTSLFKSKFNKLWTNIQSEFNNNNHLFILLKIKYVNSEFVSIGKVQRLNLGDKNWYLDFILENMKFKSEYYNETQIESLIFSYGFKKGSIPNKDRINLNIDSVIINDMKLPISLNPLDFGRFSKVINLENGKLFVLQNSKAETIMISSFETYNEVEYLKDGISLIKFKDEIVSENKFIRIINNKKYYFEDNKQVLFTKEMTNKKGKFISKTSKSKNLSNNFIILDIETFIKDNILVPFCISIFDGKIKTHFYLTDYNNLDEMILDSLNSILIRKYNGYNVYMHNMAKFDIIFLFKYLLKLGTVNPKIHNDRLIFIEFNYGKNNEYQIKFKDSLLLLLRSLDTLSKAFNVENKKTMFPIFFVNENNLDYIGEVPDIKYFKDININDYETYKSKFNNNWNLRKEAVEYCNLDCISLYQVLLKFNEMIFKYFGKNIHHYHTLPSLAMAIYRSNFMPENLIAQLSGKVAEDIRSGYTGGAVDMYIPESSSSIICLDVNSLYPSQMQSQLMPVDKPTYFEGDIRKIKSNTFGFFFCEIIAPEDILHPIIQTRVKINGVTKTIAPVGCWEDMLFSEELYNAEKYGYKFNILWGYTFNSENIFKEYVDFLYFIKFVSSYLFLINANNTTRNIKCCLWTTLSWFNNFHKWS